MSKLFGYGTNLKGGQYGYQMKDLDKGIKNLYCKFKNLLFVLFYECKQTIVNKPHQDLNN